MLREPDSRLEQDAGSVWKELERRMERLQHAATLPELPRDEMQRCLVEVRQALDLYLFLRQKQARKAALPLPPAQQRTAPRYAEPA